MIEIDEPIILIGPLKAGKSTVGKLLAKRLGWDFISLDVWERQYTEAKGFDEAKATALLQTGGEWARYRYRRQFFADAVAQFLAEHHHGVLELGGGHPIVPAPEHQAQVARALAPHPYVILLLPTPDKAESLAILRSRQKPKRLTEGDWNERFMEDDQFVRLAKHIIYTADKTPEETCQAIIDTITA